MGFASIIASKDHIKVLIQSASGVKAKHEDFHKALDGWWMHNMPLIEALPVSQNVFKLRREFLTSVAEALVPQGMLDLHQIRGAFAAAEAEDADVDDVENGVLTKEVVKSLRADKKAIGGELTGLKKRPEGLPAGYQTAEHLRLALRGDRTG